MLNFIKSEYYRMIHTTGIRVFFGILSVLTILLISGISIVETQYHTTSFSYSILVSSPMFFTLMGMLTASVPVSYTHLDVYKRQAEDDQVKHFRISQFL